RPHISPHPPSSSIHSLSSLSPAPATPAIYTLSLHDALPILHGDQDTYVSYGIAKAAVSSRNGADFHTIRGSDHGFDSTERENEAIRVSTDWLETRAKRT